MTGKDLLTAMSGIDGRYIEEAAPAAAPKTRSLRRPLLVAAAIAAALLLVGCGIVYALRLQDMSIGKATYTQRFDDKGKAIDPVEKSLDIITPYGRSGDAIQQALKEFSVADKLVDAAPLLADPEHRLAVPGFALFAYKFAATKRLQLCRQFVRDSPMNSYARFTHLGESHKPTSPL